MLNYSKTEEAHAEKIVKSIADSGVNLIVVGGSVADLMLHYIEKYKIMVVRIMSKFELKRICSAVGATALASLVAPTKDE
jgi:chaperonin GroEL (HSP60 family)